MWQTVNKVSRRKSTAKAKLKATSQEERTNLSKQYFENLLGKTPKVTHEPITKITSNQLDIKLGQFTPEEFDLIQKKKINKIGKQQVLMKYLQKYGRPWDSTTYCSDTVIPYISKTQLTNGQRDASSLSLRRVTSE